MKVTIAQLQEKIGRLEREKTEWYEKYRELKAEDEKRNQYKMARFEEDERQTDLQIKNLMEIIRWQIRPNTAESPFMPNKSERDGNRSNY